MTGHLSDEMMCWEKWERVSKCDGKVDIEAFVAKMGEDNTTSDGSMYTFEVIVTTTNCRIKKKCRSNEVNQVLLMSGCFPNEQIFLHGGHLGGGRYEYTGRVSVRLTPKQAESLHAKSVSVYTKILLKGEKGAAGSKITFFSGKVEFRRPYQGIIQEWSKQKLSKPAKIAFRGECGAGNTLILANFATAGQLSTDPSLTYGAAITKNTPSLALGCSNSRITKTSSVVSSGFHSEIDFIDLPSLNTRSSKVNVPELATYDMYVVSLSLHTVMFETRPSVYDDALKLIGRLTAKGIKTCLVITFQGQITGQERLAVNHKVLKELSRRRCFGTKVFFFDHLKAIGKYRNLPPYKLPPERFALLEHIFNCIVQADHELAFKHEINSATLANPTEPEAVSGASNCHSLSETKVLCAASFEEEDAQSDFIIIEQDEHCGVKDASDEYIEVQCT